MKPISIVIILVAAVVAVQLAVAQSTAPFTAAEREEIYAQTIERRATNILGALMLKDINKIRTRAGRHQSTIPFPARSR